MLKLLLLTSLLFSSAFSFPMLLPLGGPSSPMSSQDPGFGFMRLLSDIMSEVSGSQQSDEFFDFEPGMKYDVTMQTWTRNCSDVESCQYGVYTNDLRDDVCPSCYVTVNQVCGKWYGECEPVELTCKYDDVTYKGRCVPKSEMTSLGEGKKCWDSEGFGSCHGDLRCQHDADPMTSFVSVSGICVTNETFSQRNEGQTCGPKVGSCHGDDLTCSENIFLGQKFCRKTPECDTQGSSGVMVIEFDGADKDGVERHVEFVGDGSQLPQQLIEEIPMLSLFGEVLGESLLPTQEENKGESSEGESPEEEPEEYSVEEKMPEFLDGCTFEDEGENDSSENAEENDKEEDEESQQEKREDDFEKNVIVPDVVEPIKLDDFNTNVKMSQNDEGVKEMNRSFA